MRTKIRDSLSIFWFVLLLLIPMFIAWNTDRIYQGGQYIEVEAPKHKIPVFIRQGAAIDLGNLNELYQESLKIASQKHSLAELEKAEGWR